jgi:hypothetical protein
MSKFITISSLDQLSEPELRSKFCQLAQELYRIVQENFERTLVLASIETVQRALSNKRHRSPQFPGF